jgi:hypothetical protein
MAEDRTGLPAEAVAVAVLAGQAALPAEASAAVPVRAADRRVSREREETVFAALFDGQRYALLPGCGRSQTNPRSEQADVRSARQETG